MDNSFLDSQISLYQTMHADNAKLSQTTQALKDTKRIDETAKEFEAVFIAEMMKPMFDGISADPPYGGGKGEEMFRSLMLQEYGKSVARTGQLGIAKQVKAAMLEIQASRDTNSNTSTNQIPTLDIKEVKGRQP